MDTQNAYNIWSEQYDANINKTRDLEAVALQDCLNKLVFKSCLELGCGTGKNTEWLLTKAESITSVDFSEEMLSKAREKISSEKVDFRKADIIQEWDFINTSFDLVSYSLVLEHIEDLNSIFQKTSEVLSERGYMYLGELHPFKQYSGSKARFETNEGLEILTCFTHHISDFTDAARSHDFKLLDIKEYFDNNDRQGIPRILSLLFQKE